MSTSSPAGRDPQMIKALQALRKARGRLEELDAERREPIAVVGMACRAPGAENTAELWRMLAVGETGITEVPANRWDVDAFYDPAGTAGKLSTRRGGFCDQDWDEMDAAFFGIAPREAEQVDARQRLFLEVAQEALDDAGVIVPDLAGGNTGIFLGVSSSDQEWLELTSPSTVDEYTGTGTSTSVAAGRLAYLYDLRGPAVAVDTACSSSLVATHLACRSLRTGESEIAVVGGVYTMTSPLFAIALDRLGLLSADGRCRTFDAAAAGTVAAEGCGVVILKRLRDARSAGDRVLAVIRGSAINQDGRSAGLTAPAYASQVAVIRKALDEAGLEPSAVQHVEAHGTGTPLGDPVEVEALATVYGKAGEVPCLLGSVKSNLGHTMTAAGVLGLIKVVLSLRHGAVPPVAGFETPSPHLDLNGTRLEVADRLSPWPAAEGPRVAALSSFGWSGTNAHVILGDAPDGETEASEAAAGERDHLLVLSARSPRALDDLLRSYADFIGKPEAPSLRDVCHTAGLRRTAREYRAAVVARDAGTAAERLRSLADAGDEGTTGEGLVRPPVEGPQARGPVFVFAGQGSQWIGMGRDLLSGDDAFGEPFRLALEEFDRHFEPLAGFSVRAELMADETSSRLHETAVVQPVLCALQLAQVALWSRLGVQPAAVVGHSVGEIAAAVTAGILDTAAAARLAYHRGRLMQEAPSDGRMVAVRAGREKLEQRLRTAGLEDRVSVAAANSPRSAVLSGPEKDVEALVSDLEAEGVDIQRLPVRYAFHSPQMDSFGEKLRAELAGLAPRAGDLPLYSTVTGGLAADEPLDAGYWGRGIRAGVRFADAVAALADDGYDTFVEIGPHRVLAGDLRQILEDRGVIGTILASGRRDRPFHPVFLEAAGGLFARGLPVDLAACGLDAGRRVDLPAYPWQRRKLKRRRSASAGDPLAVPAGSLLGVRQDSGDGRKAWSRRLSVASVPWLDDHRVEGAVVVPGTAWVEMALAALADLAVDRDGEPVRDLESFEIHGPLVLADGGGAEGDAEVQVVWTPEDGTRAARLEIFSRPSKDTPWTLHATALPRAGSEPLPEPEAGLRDRADADTVFDAEEYYGLLARWGLHYGPSFQGIRRVARHGDSAVVELEIPSGPAEQWSAYRLHPAVLDAAFQGAGVLVDEGPDGRPWVPVKLGRLCLAPAATALPRWARLDPSPGASEPGRRGFHLRLLTEEGRTVVSVENLVLHRLAEAEETRPRDERFRLVAEESALELSGIEEPTVRRLVIDGGGDGFAAAVATALNADLGRPEEPAINGKDEVVFVAGSDDSDDLAAFTEKQCKALASVVRAIAGARPTAGASTPRLLVLTRGTADPSAAAVLGLARTVGREHPELKCLRVDVAVDLSTEDAARILAGESALTEGEEESRWSRDEVSGELERRVMRLRSAEDEDRPRALRQGEACRLESDRPGVIDALRLTALGRQTPAADEVELEVVAAGLNFSDVMKAMGIYPGLPDGPLPLGIECAGRVTAVGSGVEGLATGDEVIAFGFFTLASRVILPASLVVAKPGNLTLPEAACVPVAFGTAHYALDRLGAMAAGEKVLIHSASGGVGQAAVQLARAAGAEIFATAGTEAKRQFLREQGIEHVMDSRSLDFVRQIHEITDGRGLDLVLNSLAGEALAAGLDCLAEGGRFLELGKRDIYGDSALGMAPFRRNLSFFAIDLDQMCRRKPERVGALLHELVPRFESKELVPPTFELIPVADVQEPFRTMSRGRHLGKLVIDFEKAEGLPAAPPSELRCDAVGVWILTGGLGGLGLRVADFLVQRGAKRLILVGRSGLGPVDGGRPPRDDAHRAVEAWRERGVRVAVARADVARWDELRTALADALERVDGKEIRGVVHAAGVLRDRLLMDQTDDDWARVLAPKVAGAVNLARFLEERGQQPEYFVSFSSISAVLGTPGQSNYAAANAFLDAFTYRLRARGIRAASIGWGPWGEVGMAAGLSSEQRAAMGGVRPLPPTDALAQLEYLMVRDEPETVVSRVVGGRWPAFAHGSPLLDLPSAAMDRAPEDTDMPLVDRLRGWLADALQCAAAEVDLNRSLVSLGLDSLMAVELKNRVLASTGVDIPLSKLLLAPSATALAEQIREKAGITAPVHESVSDAHSEIEPRTQPEASPSTEAWEELTL